MAAPSDVRLLAFYLPQYHPIPENDSWWGPGFTEWNNVVAGRPWFPGHDQPHIPADLGFYDLRLPETRQAQASMAREYGIHGFCYYHYWFHGKRLLGRPFDEVFHSGEPDLPFCLCWANERWARNWSGEPYDVLLEQTYSEPDDIEHIRWLCQVFSDRRYIRIGGRPLLLVYRALDLPDPERTATLWRKEALRIGCSSLYLCAVERKPLDGQDPRNYGFDGTVRFAPDVRNFSYPRGFLWRVANRIGVTTPLARSRVIDYEQVALAALDNRPDYPSFPCITPHWDNSARRPGGGALILKGSSPERYGKWLRDTIDQFEPVSADENLVFVNAWNEWGEGNHLEPDQRWGRAYLDQHRLLHDRLGP